jgi:hypothetical protein
MTSTPQKYLLLQRSSQRMRSAGHAARIIGIRNACKSLVGTLKRTRSLGCLRHSWKDTCNIKFYLEIVPEDVDRMHLIEDRIQYRAELNAVRDLRGTFY